MEETRAETYHRSELDGYGFRDIEERMKTEGGWAFVSSTKVGVDVDCTLQKQNNKDFAACYARVMATCLAN